MDQNQREFLVEIEELVEQIFDDLEELRTAQADGGGTSRSRSNRQLIDRIFRRVHSVKGSAASCELEVVSEIAHEFENLLEEVRAGQVLVDDSVVDICESATEALSESLSLAASGIVEPSRHALFDRLQAAAQNKTGRVGVQWDGTEAVLKNVPFEIWQSLTEPEKQHLIDIVAQGTPLVVVATSFDIGDFDAQFFLLKEKLAQFGEVISTSPAVDDQHSDRINFRLLYASDADLPKIKASVADVSQVEFKEIPFAGDGAVLGDDETTDGLAAPLFSSRSLASLSNFVRTDLDKLDQLISSTHELLRTTTNALDLALFPQRKAAPAWQALERLSGQIRSSFMLVEDQLINLRMVSLGPTLQRAVRAGRAAARVATKEIDFEIVGDDLDIDKLLADAIVNPLIQLVRNAVDHGIESAEDRLQAGKKRRGTVRIEVVSEGSQSRLRVIDDGRGIDPFLVSGAATRLGLLRPDSQLDIERSLRLIFRPGFTTVASVSGVSGRGVGLDVVETAVELVGGELRVSSEPKRGTTFEIRLPVTFGLLAANVVVSAGNRYCIPAAQTLGIDAIEVIDGSSGADQLRQVSMRDLLDQPEEPEDSNNQLHLITCQYTDERAGISKGQRKCIGIVVDRVEGPQEVLVRSLGRHAGRWRGIAGAAELKDGRIALVLDLPRLLSTQR